MGTTSIEDGTWTLNVQQPRGGIWTAWIVRSAVLHPRFQRARLTADGEKAVLIAADRLRDAVKEWLADPNGHERLPVKIDVKCKTVNGLPVEMLREA